LIADSANKWQAKGMTSSIQSIAIIGQGKLGKSFARLASKCGLQVLALARDYSDFIVELNAVDLILITTTDGAIKEVANNLAQLLEQGQTNSSKPIVAHCSGSLSSQILEPIGERIASCHPLNSFPNEAAAVTTFANNEHGTVLYAEGNEQALQQLAPFYERLGFNFQRLDNQNKTLYHLACVMACNYLSVLMHSSLDIAEQAGLNRKDFWQALKPILATTLDNIDQHDTQASLSGPIARADLATIKDHLNELDSEITAELYRVLGRQAADMAHQGNSITAQQLEKIREILGDSTSGLNGR